MNGVINITSKSAKDTQGVYVEGGGGSELLDFGGLRYGGKVGTDVYYRVYAKYFDRDKAAYSDGSDAADSWRMAQGGFRMDAEPSADEKFTLQGDVYGGDEDISEGGNSRLDGNNVLGRWSRTISSDSDMSLQMYYDRTYLYLPKNANAYAPAGVLVDSLDTYDLDFQHRFLLRSGHNVIWGLGYRFTHDVVQDAPSVAFDPSTLDQNLFNLFAQDEITLAEKLSLTLGSKVEHNDYTGFEFEPSARLKWDLAENQMFWAAISRAVRTPSRVDRDERVPTPAFSPFVDNLLIGGADFLSEILVAYELGYRAQLSPALSTSLSVFFNNYDDIRSTVPGILPESLLVFANGLEAQTYGGEFTLDYQILDGWQLHGGYDLLKETVWVKPGQTDFSNTLNETADPQNQVFIRSSMNLPGNLELNPALRWVDSFIYNNNQVPATVPSYVELDVRLGWKIGNDLEVSITGQSLLHDHHSEYVISSPDPAEDVQRSFYGKVAWKL